MPAATMCSAANALRLDFQLPEGREQALLLLCCKNPRDPTQSWSNRDITGSLHWFRFYGHDLQDSTDQNAGDHQSKTM